MTEEGLQTALHAALDLHRRQRLDAALLAYLQILRHWPESPDAHCLLGHLYIDTGRLDDGLTHLDRAASLSPERVDFHFSLGTALLRHGRSQAAVQALYEAYRLKPDEAAVVVNLAVARRQCGQFDEAVRELNGLLDRLPEIVEARHNLANCLADLGRVEESLVEYERALRQRPEAVDVRVSLAVNLCRWHRYEDAIVQLERALVTAPGHPLVHQQLGKALMVTGRLADAEAHFRQALAVAPMLAEVHQTLADIVTHQPGDADIAAMEDQLKRPHIDELSGVRLHFGLGKAYADCRDYERAFAHYAEANRMQRRRIRYDSRETDAEFARIRRAFERDLLDLPPAREAGPRLVFIVGMPRSGTSLIEQILATHPEVYGAGETTYLLDEMIVACRSTPFGVPEGLFHLEADGLAGIAARYVGRMKAQAGLYGRADAAVMTDKMPHNFRYVGLIAHLWPDAVILHTRRHPIDVCLSCFQQFFAEGNPYAYDLQDLGHYFTAYENLMAFWRERLPGRLIEIDYEGLVADREPAIRRLLDVCGLSWDERCLDFHRSKRGVDTASAAQVRKPIYQSSVERWRRYESQLKPLQELLIANGVLKAD